MDSGVDSVDNDWRTQLRADSRYRIVNKIIETLKRHLPFSGEEELKKIATRFEEKVYNLATSQTDYLRKISLKMLTLETKSQNIALNSMVSSFGGNPIDPETAVSFISWSEEMDTERDTYGQFRFYLYSTKLGNVLAAKGDPYQRNTHQILYFSDTMFVNTFGGQFRRAICERWNTYDDCVNWLKGFISSSSGSSSSNDANTTIRQEAANLESMTELPKASDCFFKVMLGNFGKELSIPAKYCRIFNHCTANQRIILRNGSRSWIVVVNNHVMRGGWEEFVKDHKIKQGEFLVFNHAESNIYDVKIFSCTGCGNCYRWSSDNKEKTTANAIATVAEHQEEAVNALR